MRVNWPWRGWQIERLELDWEAVPVEGENQGGIPWAPGAMDGVRSHHVAPGNPASREIDGQIVELLAVADKKRLNEVYRALTQTSCLSYIDPVLTRLNENRTTLDFNRLRRLALYLCRRSRHAEATKAGIALLGLAGTADDLEIVLDLGRDDEFTLFAATAAARLSPDPESTLWAMAKEVHGWGRIHLVERLAGTERDDIRAWLLREGFGYHSDYLGCVCARAGRLHEALASPVVDRALLDGAAGLFRGMLFDPPPADDIDYYEEAPEAVERYVQRVGEWSGAGLDHLLLIHGLAARFEAGHGSWSEDRRLRGLAALRGALAWERWPEHVRLGLTSPNVEEFTLADDAAKALNIDTFQIHFDRVKAQPIGSESWRRLLEQTDAGRIDAVLAFAGDTIPLGDIATGPAMELGLGPQWAAHRALDWVLKALARFPGEGGAFVEAGLRSPDILNRNLAIDALSAWPRALWPASAETLLAACLAEEPDSKVRARLEKLEE